jgi:hypothetical protein
VGEQPSGILSLMSEVERLHLTRRQLLRRLPESGEPGSAAYRRPGATPPLDGLGLDPDSADRLAEIAAESATGSVLLAPPAEGPVMLVVPPFPVEMDEDYSEQYTKPLIELVERERVVAVMLLRLGGFSIGVFRGGTLLDSKTDQRFVKNRNRKGGQSQRRFERIREKQIHELFGKACAESRERLDPYEHEIQHVLFGGDRHTLQAFRKECSYFERFGERLLTRVLPVPGNPRRDSLDAMPAEIWSSTVYVAHRAG